MFYSGLIFLLSLKARYNTMKYMRGKKHEGSYEISNCRNFFQTTQNGRFRQNHSDKTDYGMPYLKADVLLSFPRHYGCFLEWNLRCGTEEMVRESLREKDPVSALTTYVMFTHKNRNKLQKLLRSRSRAQIEELLIESVTAYLAGMVQGSGQGTEYRRYGSHAEILCLRDSRHLSAVRGKAEIE